MHVSWAEELDKAAHCCHSCCLSNAIHGRNINLPLCVCPSHFLSTRLQVRPLNGFLQLKDADLQKDVPFGGFDDE